jgi:hypothetical protein
LCRQEGNGTSFLDVHSSELPGKAAAEGNKPPLAVLEPVNEEKCDRQGMFRTQIFIVTSRLMGARYGARSMPVFLISFSSGGGESKKNKYKKSWQ